MNQTIHIIVVNIPEAYGVILNRDWLAKLKKYFSTNCYHLWLPYKDHPNKIKVDRERYMKHTLTDLNDTNEPVMFSNSILGNFYLDTIFGELEVELSPLANSEKQFELLYTTHIVEPHCTLVDNCTKVYAHTCTNIFSSSSNFSLELIDPHIWTLYFDGSRNKELEGVGCLLIDPHNNKTMLAFHLEFDCTNNLFEYEALVQGLKKALYLKVKYIEVFINSQIVI